MSTHDLPSEPESIVKQPQSSLLRPATPQRSRFDPQDMEDMIQAATLAYWKHHREGRPVPSASSAPARPPRSTSIANRWPKPPQSSPPGCPLA